MKKESINKQPFSVPEGYFESFPDRLKERMEGLDKELTPVRRIGRSTRFRLAMAAAIVGLALVSIPLLKMIDSGNGNSDEYQDIALLEGAGLFSSEYELVEYFVQEENALDEEEAYLGQAMDYLAMNDVEIDLIFE